MLAVEEARSSVASLIHVPAERLAFLPSTTWAINAVANGIPWQPGDRVVTTVLEHHSNFLPWLNLRQRGVEVAVVPSDPSGFVDPCEFSRQVEGARLVAFTHVTNAIGTIQDIGWLTAEARAAGAIVMIDGAQGASHLDADIGAIAPDAYAFSSHKCFGPTGVGALYLSGRLLDSLLPSVLGGGSATDSSPDGFELRLEPKTARLEPGTQNIAGIIGFGAAADFRSSLDWSGISHRTDALLQKLMDGLRSIRGVTVYGPLESERKTPVVSFNVPGCTPHQAGMLLGKNHGIMVRSGHHCAPTLWKTLYGRPSGAIRASLHAYSEEGEVECLVNAVEGMVARS